MADLFRRALSITSGEVRIRSNVATAPSREALFAVLAEGTQWEVHVAGGGTWHLDVPEHCRNLSPAERMAVVNEIMHRLAGGQKSAPPALTQDKPRVVSRRPELRIAYDHA